MLIEILRARPAETCFVWFLKKNKTFEVSQLGSHFEGKARLKFCVEPYLFKKKNLLWYILLGADGKVTTE